MSVSLSLDRLNFDELVHQLHVLTDVLDGLKRTLSAMPRPAPVAYCAFSSDDDDDGSDLDGFINDDSDEEVSSSESDGSTSSDSLDDEDEGASQDTEITQSSVEEDQDDDDISSISSVRVTRSMGSNVDSRSRAARTSTVVPLRTSSPIYSADSEVIEQRSTSSASITPIISALPGSRDHPLIVDSSSDSDSSSPSPDWLPLVVDCSDSDSSQLSTIRPKRRRTGGLDSDETEANSGESRTRELESMRVQCAELSRKVEQLKMKLARRQRETEALQAVSKSTILRAGKMRLFASRKISLNKDNNASSYARAFDFNGKYFAVGVHVGGNVPQPYAILRIDRADDKFKLCSALPLHSKRSRFIAFSPFGSSLVISGGEDNRAVVHCMGESGSGQNHSIRREWTMPAEKPVWSGCWLSEDRLALGLQNGRVWEFAFDSSEPIKDYTQGLGNMPVIFVAFDTASSVLLVASFKMMLAFRNDRVYSLLNSTEDHFVSMRSVCWDEPSLSFVATFTPGGRHSHISHRLYKLMIPDDSPEVSCVEVSSWNTTNVLSSTLWNNALFSIEQSLFSLVFNEDRKRLEAHDWSDKRGDVDLPFHSTMNICSMRPLPSPAGSLERTVALLTESSIFSVSLRIDSST